MTKISLLSKTLAISLLPFVDVVAAFARKDRVTAIKLIVACEVTEILFLVACAFTIGRLVS